MPMIKKNVDRNVKWDNFTVGKWFPTSIEFLIKTMTAIYCAICLFGAAASAAWKQHSPSSSGLI